MENVRDWKLHENKMEVKEVVECSDKAVGAAMEYVESVKKYKEVALKFEALRTSAFDQVQHFLDNLESIKNVIG